MTHISKSISSSYHKLSVEVKEKGLVNVSKQALSTAKHKIGNAYEVSYHRYNYYLHYQGFYYC